MINSIRSQASHFSSTKICEFLNILGTFIIYYLNAQDIKQAFIEASLFGTVMSLKAFFLAHSSASHSFMNQGYTIQLLLMVRVALSCANNKKHSWKYPKGSLSQPTPPPKMCPKHFLLRFSPLLFLMCHWSFRFFKIKCKAILHSIKNKKQTLESFHLVLISILCM